MIADFYIHKKGDINNPTVILIHGLLGASRNLWRLQDILSQNGFYTISYDQRGHGHSLNANHAPLTLETLSSDLVNILNSENVQKAHLVGHSMGGRVAMITSYFQPELVTSLTMIDVSPKVNTKAIDTLHKIIDPLPDAFNEKNDAAEFFKKSLPLQGKEYLMFEQFLMSNLKNINGKYHWVFDLNGIRKSLLPSLANDQFEKWNALQLPILILRGENSVHFTQSELETMTNTNQNIESHIVENAGHWVHVDNLESTANGILNFLNKNNRR